VNGEAIIQSPSIGNALRSALSLDAAGGLPLDMATTVHPVCIVGDVRAQLGSSTRSYSGYRNAGAVAANYSKVALEVPAALGASLRYVVPRRVRLYLGGSATIYWRMGSNTPPVSTDAPSRPTDTSSTAAGFARMIGGQDATPPSLSTMQGIVQITPGLQVEWINMPEMRIHADAATPQTLCFFADTVNIQLVAECLWDEYLK